MKIDVEAAEYHALDDMLADARNIAGVALEVHDLGNRGGECAELLRRVSHAYVITHLHGNRCAPHIGSSGLPTVLKLTFVNKSLLTADEAPSPSGTTLPSLAGICRYGSMSPVPGTGRALQSGSFAAKLKLPADYVLARGAFASAALLTAPGRLSKSHRANSLSASSSEGASGAMRGAPRLAAFRRESGETSVVSLASVPNRRSPIRSIPAIRICRLGWTPGTKICGGFTTSNAQSGFG